ncbi:hypothetical protein ACOI1H_14670 [Loktanella sp. DJP18]|uniref:hypothetical protein n=1 Tax=Loktanella sp. DJP18 TaxID=3409788 RepID=UPI003BB80B2B
MTLRWLWVDPWIACKIPELRKLIAAAYGLRIARNVVGSLSLLLCIPFIPLIFAGRIAQWLCRRLTTPHGLISNLHDDARNRVRATMSVEEIRRRAYGEERPRILPNTLRRRP